MAKRLATIGSISHGTMREEDLIPCFVSALRGLGHRSKELSRIERELKTKDYYFYDNAIYDLEDLFNMLQEHAPDYVYFGSHPGDGSDYGFWVSDSLEYDFDGPKVADTADIPDDYRGYVLHVNDHGNMTLYNKSARKLTEIWAVV